MAMKQYVLWEGKVYWVGSEVLNSTDGDDWVILHHPDIIKDPQTVYDIVSINELTPIDPLEAFAILSKEHTDD